MTSCLSFLKTRYADDLTHYNGQNIDVLLAILREKYPQNETGVHVDTGNNHRKRHLAGLDVPLWETITVDTVSSNPAHSVHLKLDMGGDTDIVPERLDYPTPMRTATRDNPVLGHILFLASKSKHSSVPPVPSSHSMPPSPAHFPSAQRFGDVGHLTQTGSMQSSQRQSSEGANAPESSSAKISHHRHGSRNHTRDISTIGGQSGAATAPRQLPSHNMQDDDRLSTNRTRRESSSDDDDETSTGVTFHEVVSPEGVSFSPDDNTTYGGSYLDTGSTYDNSNGRMTKHIERLLKTAHILHYISIAILGVFVMQVSN